MRWNPEVLVRKDTRQLQVCTKEDDPSAFERLVNQSRKAYDHSIRRYVLGSKPWVFPWLEERVTGISRRDPTIDLDKEKWRLAAKEAKRAKKKKRKGEKTPFDAPKTARRRATAGRAHRESARALTRVQIRGIRENEHA